MGYRIDMIKRVAASAVSGFVRVSAPTNPSRFLDVVHNELALYARPAFVRSSVVSLLEKPEAPRMEFPICEEKNSDVSDWRRVDEWARTTTVCSISL